MNLFFLFAVYNIYIYTYIHTYVNTYIHTYIHTYIIGLHYRIVDHALVPRDLLFKLKYKNTR